MSTIDRQQQIRQSVLNLTYRELQTSLRAYREQGLTTIKLNRKKVELQDELVSILWNQNKPDSKPNHLKAEPVEECTWADQEGNVEVSEPTPTVDCEYLQRGIQARRERMARREQVRLLPVILHSEDYITTNAPIECEDDNLPPTLPVTEVEVEVSDHHIDYGDDFSDYEDVMAIFEEIYNELHPVNKVQEITSNVRKYLRKRTRYHCIK